MRCGFVSFAFTLTCFVFGCAAPAQSSASGHVPSSEAPIAASAASTVPAAGAVAATPPPREQEAAVPVSVEDPIIGDPTAPVTLVLFGDFECPFTARFVESLRAVQQARGPHALRIVWKNEPLVFHPNARAAAIAAQAVFMLGGNDAFWRFHERAFQERKRLGEALEEIAQSAGVDVVSFRALVASGAPAKKVEADLALGRKLEVGGAPGWFVNGVFVGGMRAEKDVLALVDQERKKADLLLAEGIAAPRLYVVASNLNYVARPKTPAPSEDDARRDDSSAVFAVNIGKSPARGSAKAPVTIVEFADFQCPYSKRVQATLDALRTSYGNKIRIVWKNEPLPFHPRAVPAANLALEARAEKGDAGFWAAHDALFASQPKLEDDDLRAIGRKLGLKAAKVDEAIAGQPFTAALADDKKDGEAVNAQGTPHFFVNGHRLVGAQPIEKFKAIIDQALASRPSSFVDVR